METNVNYTSVGIFVIVMIGMIIFAIIWLSSGFATNKNYLIYQVNMKESVSGLSIDAPVEYNGVKVGTVFDMSIAHKQPHNVILLLKILDDTPISSGTTAKLDARALSGIAFIALEDKGQNNTPLKATSGQKYPVIPTVPSIFVRLDTALTQLNNNFHNLSTSIQSLLNKENLRYVKHVLQASQNSLKTIEVKTLPSINQTFDNMEEITSDLSDVSADMKQDPSVLIRGKAGQDELGPGEK